MQQQDFQKIEQIELKIEALNLLLDKPYEELKPSEKKKVDSYDTELAELEEEKKRWIKIAQTYVTGKYESFESLVMSKFEAIAFELKDIRQEVKDIRQEVKDIRQEVKDIRQEVKDIKQEMKDIKQEVKDVRQENIVNSIKLEDLNQSNKGIIIKNEETAIKLKAASLKIEEIFIKNAELMKKKQRIGLSTEPHSNETAVKTNEFKQRLLEFYYDIDSPVSQITRLSNLE